jgi:osmotically-inducible protein OsmY
MNIRASLLVSLTALSLLLGACAHRTMGEGINDATISARANAALAGSPVTSAWNVSVETFQGVVLLSGFVGSEEERAEAERLVSQVDGVERVENNIELRPEDG